MSPLNKENRWDYKIILPRLYNIHMSSTMKILGGPRVCLLKVLTQATTAAAGLIKPSSARSAQSRLNQDQLSANQRRRFKGQFSQIEGIIFRGLCSLKTKYSWELLLRANGK